MSSTMFWAEKYWLMLHEEDGYAAEGVPQDEGSTEPVAWDTEVGTLFLCVIRQPHSAVKYRLPRTRTLQNQMLTAGQQMSP